MPPWYRLAAMLYNGNRRGSTVLYRAVYLGVQLLTMSICVTTAGWCISLVSCFQTGIPLRNQLLATSFQSGEYKRHMSRSSYFKKIIRYSLCVPSPDHVCFCLLPSATKFQFGMLNNRVGPAIQLINILGQKEVDTTHAREWLVDAAKMNRAQRLNLIIGHLILGLWLVGRPSIVRPNHH